jgi:hypothetical protein
VQRFQAISERFDLILYRDATDVVAARQKGKRRELKRDAALRVTASASALGDPSEKLDDNGDDGDDGDDGDPEELPSLDLTPTDAYGDKDVLVWIDCRGDAPLEELRVHLQEIARERSLPWAIVVSAQNYFAAGLLESELGEIATCSTVEVPPASGTAVNESNDDLIRIVPALVDGPGLADAATSTADIVEALGAVLPGGGSNYIQRLLVGKGRSLIVRGMAPNTRFLFELRNDLIDGTLARRFNEAIYSRHGVGTGVSPFHRSCATDAGGSDGEGDDALRIGGVSRAEWAFDKSAFASIYLRILSKMDQLTPHQKIALSACRKYVDFIFVSFWFGQEYFSFVRIPMGANTASYS